VDTVVRRIPDILACRQREARRDHEQDANKLSQHAASPLQFVVACSRPVDRDSVRGALSQGSGWPLALIVPVIGAALALCVLGALLPTWRAARMLPAEALRRQGTARARAKMVLARPKSVLMRGAGKSAGFYHRNKDAEKWGKVIRTAKLRGVGRRDHLLAW
jgi:hypothetical protein